MTLSDLLTDEKLRQHEFPVAREKIYLAHAGVCPLSRRVAEAIHAYINDATRMDQELFVLDALLHHARELAAQLIKARPAEIAFVGPTSLALSYVASGLQWRKNDNLVAYFDDYPSNVYPWTALAEQGVEVRFVNPPELGQVRLEDVRKQVDENTRLVALASAHFISGYRIDLPAISKFLREQNILFCVDGIQTLGAFPTLAEHADFLAADAHKWMLGPCAAGIFYVRQSLQEQLLPPVYGWNNVRCPDYVAQERVVLRSGPRRYEVGTTNLLGLVGLSAALELLLELGIDPIAAELSRKRAWFVPALQKKGYDVLNADAKTGNAGAIISIHRPDADLTALHRHLAQVNVVTSLRADRAAKQYIRFSPHFYNTDTELQRVLDLL
jgi:cysteine desulfurase/selenocysteine lyase